MFERFTDRAKRVVVLAQVEARRLNHNYIGTEHLLLGLVAEEEGVAARALTALGISIDKVRQEVQEIVGSGTSPPTGHIPFTPRAKKALELSLREALTLGHNYIGTEHMLLGLVTEGEGVAAVALSRLGASLSRVRQEVVQQLSGHPGWKQAAGGEAAEPRCPSCREKLADVAAHRVLQVSEEEGAEPVAVRFVFCRHCGSTLGNLPL